MWLFILVSSFCLYLTEFSEEEIFFYIIDIEKFYWEDQGRQLIPDFQCINYVNVNFLLLLSITYCTLHYSHVARFILNVLLFGTVFCNHILYICNFTQFALEIGTSLKREEGEGVWHTQYDVPAICYLISV